MARCPGRLQGFQATLPLKEAAYRQFTAKRRIVMFEPVPQFLAALRDKAGAWGEIPAAKFVHALVTEYRPGTQLGWHRDSPEYGELAGISLGGHCRMRLRPFPPKKGERKDILSLDLEPRWLERLQVLHEVVLFLVVESELEVPVIVIEHVLERGEAPVVVEAAFLVRPQPCQRCGAVHVRRRAIRLE